MTDNASLDDAVKPADTAATTPAGTVVHNGDGQHSSIMQLITEVRESDPGQGPAVPGSITVVYDDGCPFCVRCWQWLETQVTHVPLEPLPISNHQAAALYSHVADFGKELMLVADDGRMWIGPDAFLMAMWATVRFRPLAYRLSQGGMGRLAERFFNRVSAGRGTLSSLVGAWTSDRRMEPLERQADTGDCTTGTCNTG